MERKNTFNFGYFLVAFLVIIGFQMWFTSRDVAQISYSDMINYIDEEGVRVEPRAALRLPVGATVAQAVEAYGVKYVIPFSSLHKYRHHFP